jgi:type I restriction enzyme S subunit
MVKMNELFKYQTIRAGRIQFDRLNLTEQEKSKLLLADHDLLFSRTSVDPKGVGKCTIVIVASHELTYDSNIIRFQLDLRKASPLYYFYYFNSPQGRDQVRGLASGAAITTVTGKKLSQLNVPYPSLTDQNRIASVLSAYDDLIENNTRRIQILEEMAQVIYREWFVNFRFPGHEKVGMADSVLGAVPDGWEVVSLQEVCTRITDGSHRSPKTVDDGFPMASVKDMHTWGFHINQCRRISREDYDELVRNDCKPLLGDVLVAKDGSYLKHIFVVDEEQDVVILSSIALLRPNGRIHPHVLSLYLLDPAVKSRMAGYVSGVAIPRIVLKDFRTFPVIAPSLDIQNRFLDLVAPMIRDCQLLMRKNTNLRHTRDLLLPKLISGEIDVAKLNSNHVTSLIEETH